MTEMKLVLVPLMEIARRDFPPGQLDIDGVARLKKAELVEHIATASAEYRAASGESPWLLAEVFWNQGLAAPERIAPSLRRPFSPRV